jgi:hypothetical protein
MDENPPQQPMKLVRNCKQGRRCKFHRLNSFVGAALTPPPTVQLPISPLGIDTGLVEFSIEELADLCKKEDEKDGCVDWLATEYNGVDSK